MPGSTAPGNVPIATSKALRVSITSVSGAAIKSFQSAGVDIDADLAGRVGPGIAEGDDLLLQPDQQSPPALFRMLGMHYHTQRVHPIPIDQNIQLY